MKKQNGFAIGVLLSNSEINDLKKIKTKGG